MNDPYESYKLYNALKLHFESDSYDAVKYNYKTSLKPTSFFKRKDIILAISKKKNNQCFVEYANKNKINITFNLEQSEKTYVDKINIFGNFITHDTKIEFFDVKFFKKSISYDKSVIEYKINEIYNHISSNKKIVE